MLNFSPLLGINLSILGERNPLTKPSRLDRKSKFAIAQLDRGNLATLHPQLIQTSRLLTTNSIDRLHHSNQPPGIGWDNWQPDRSEDRDNFDYKVDRSRLNLADRSSQIDELESPELDFFTTVLPTEFAEIEPQPDSLPTNSVDIEIPISTNTDRATTDTIQLKSPGKVQPILVEPDRKLLESNQIDSPQERRCQRIEQPKSSVRAAQVFADIQPLQIPQASPETSLAEPLETSIASSLDYLALNTIDDPLTESLRGTSSFTTETSIDLNLDVPRSPDLDLTQISRSVVGGKPALQENITIPNSASPPELIPNPIIPNLLETPTIINPVAPPKFTPLEPTVTTNIVPESTLSPEILTQFTVGEQIATATEIAPMPASSDSLRADYIDPDPLDLPTIIDPQPPEVATTQPLLLAQRSTATENIPSVMPLAVEPLRESISDTLPVNLSDSPITNQPPSTDSAQISASLDELAMANLDLPALPSNLAPSISPPLADRAQIATEPNQIAPDVQSSQPLNPTTAQLNLAADLRNIDRDLNPIQLEPANPNIPESSSTLPADALSTNLLPVANPEQIATSPISIEADLQPTQLVDTDTPQLDSLDLTSIDRQPSALEQIISRFADEPTSENLESSPTPIVESANTLSATALSLAERYLPWRIDPDLTIESSPTLSVDSLQSSVDRSPLENSPLESTSIIALEQENKGNITELSHEFSSDKLVSSPLGDRSVINQSIVNLPQNTNQPEDLSVNIIDRSDDITSPFNNSIDNLNNTIQIDPPTIVLPTIGQEELSSTSIDNSIDPNDDNNSADSTIPAPTVGYATGGYVKEARHIDLQSIASSDTVSAMLTPGEFVINAKDAQKNLDLLTHINRGGEPEAALPNPEIQPSIIEDSSASPDISPTSIQRKRNDSLISPSLQREISLQQLSPLINTRLDPAQSSQTESSNSSPTYSSPSMVFRKPISSSQPQYPSIDTPDEWGSIEDLINGGSNNSDPFSFENISPQHPKIEPRSTPRILPQYATLTRGFADGGEVTPSDISTTIEPITQTIESPLANPQPQSENNDPAELEILAREIYHRLRQRLEIERERHGSYSGNLAW